MGWLLIFFIIMLISVIWVIYDGESFGMSIFAGFCIACIAMAILEFISIPFKKEIEIREEIQYNICGLENKYISENSAKGAFILGTGGFSGSTNTELKYYFFRENENGKKLESISGENVYIRETNEQEPCYIKKYSITKDVGFFKWLWGDMEYKHLKAKILVVPTDTIKIDYNIDI